MIDQTKNIMIGLFVIAACMIVVLILLFLHPSVGDEGLRLRVRFSDIDKVSVGTRVTYGGKAVGEVVEIRDIEDESERRRPRDGRIFLYELILQVDSNVNVFNTDEVSLRTSGLLGERTININPLPPKKGQPVRLVNDQVIYAHEVGTVEDTFKEFKEVADRFDVVFEQITNFLAEMQKEKMVESIASAAKNLSEITEALNKPEDWSNMLSGAKETVENIREVSNKLNRGTGTLSKIINDEDLYLSFRSIMSKGETVMDDINHYGLLFHLDKGWKRLRARRMNLLARLSSPQEFRNFFNDEVDEITTSLSRVNMVLSETNSSPMGPCLLEDRRFTQVFAELLRRVEGMEEALKMYNQQLVDVRSRSPNLHVEQKRR